jgi:quinohemoprotein ethanol dehydrogenase
MAAPVSYEIDGEQYVAVASGWGGAYGLLVGGLLPTGSAPNVGRVLVYKLGGTAQLPEPAAFTPVHVLAPETDASPETIAAGFMAYADNCAVCHGDHALSYGTVPNLRHSPLLGDAELWSEVVLEGAKASAGMRGWKDVFDAQTSEAIRAYVIDARKNGLQPLAD